MSSPSAGPDLHRYCPSCPSACSLLSSHPTTQGVPGELLHEILLGVAEGTGVLLGPFLLLLPLVISQAGGGGDR